MWSTGPRNLEFCKSIESIWKLCSLTWILVPERTKYVSLQIFKFKIMAFSWTPKCCWEKVYFRSQILERPSIGEYWNILGVPVLPENVIFTFFRACWYYSGAYNTGMQTWSSIVQYSHTSIWDLKYTFSCWNESIPARKIASMTPRRA